MTADSSLKLYFYEPQYASFKGFGLRDQSYPDLSSGTSSNNAATPYCRCRRCFIGFLLTSSECLFIINSVKT